MVNLTKIIWAIVMALFLSLQVYNFYFKNYYDIITTSLILAILLGMIGVYFLLARKSNT